MKSSCQFIIPRFQREYSWDKKNYQEFFEDMINNLVVDKGNIKDDQYFLGTMLFVGNFTEKPDKPIEVIDGQQRLTSFVKFLKNEITLKNLEEYTDFNGKKFMDLDKTVQRTIKNTSIHSIVIKKESQELKYEIFARLNQGSTSLKPQELRNCIYRGSFNNMLEDISRSNKTLAFLIGAENKRKSYQEMVLRYFALKNWQEYSSSIAKTLNLYMEKHQNDSKEEIEKLKKNLIQI